MGLSTTTYNEIEGGVSSDHASTKGLTDSVIHQQRDVDVVITTASGDFMSRKKSDISLPI